jgi:hypothetical protein
MVFDNAQDHFSHHDAATVCRAVFPKTEPKNVPSDAPVMIMLMLKTTSDDDGRPEC